MGPRNRRSAIVAACVGLALCWAWQGTATSVGFNPLKVVLGLINIELEVRINPHVSMHVFFEHALVAGDHPRWVLTVGPRLHAEADPQGGYLGANILIIGPTAEFAGATLGAGAECGYRIPMYESLYLQPRLMTSKSLQQHSRDSLGMEALVGVTIGGSR